MGCIGEVSVRWDVLEKYMYDGMYWRSICTMGCIGEVSVRWDVLEKYLYDGMYWRSISTMGCIGEVSVRWGVLEKYLYDGICWRSICTWGKEKERECLKLHIICVSQQYWVDVILKKGMSGERSMHGLREKCMKILIGKLEGKRPLGKSS